MEITQQDIDGLAEKIAGLELTGGETAALDAIRHVVGQVGEVEGFSFNYEKVTWTYQTTDWGHAAVGSGVDASQLKADFGTVLGWSHEVNQPR